jgi:hypothetical protein
MPTQIQLRRDTAADWTSANPTLAEGEVGYETDTGDFKIGDGATAWSSLSYFSSGGGGLSDGDYGDITVSGSGSALTIDGQIQSVSSTNAATTTVIASNTCSTTSSSKSVVIASSNSNAEGLTDSSAVIASADSKVNGNARSAVVGGLLCEANADNALVVGSVGTLNNTANSVAMGFGFPVAALTNRKIHLFGQTGNTYQAGSLMFGATTWSAATPSGGATLTFSGGSTTLGDGTNTMTLMDGSGNMTIAGDRLRITTAHTPATASATGTTGQITWDTDFLYVCVGTNSWKRAAIAAW